MLLFVQSKFKCLRNPNVITCLICMQDPVKTNNICIHILVKPYVDYDISWWNDFYKFLKQV